MNKSSMHLIPIWLYGGNANNIKLDSKSWQKTRDRNSAISRIGFVSTFCHDEMGRVDVVVL